MSRTGLTTLGEFGCGSNTANNTLPVVLLDFNGYRENENVILNWSTASEQNSHYFEIEKSYNLTDWMAVSQLNSKGNSNTIMRYKYIDLESSNSTVYYRLKQVDFDGKYEYFKEISILSLTTRTVSIYPNPMISGNNLSVVINDTDDIINSVIEIYSLDGKRVLYFVPNNKDGKIIINTSSLAKGTYMISVKNANKTEVRKLLVL